MVNLENLRKNANLRKARAHATLEVAETAIEGKGGAQGSVRLCCAFCLQYTCAGGQS
jgi:hypothetical protein